MSYTDLKRKIAFVNGRFTLNRQSAQAKGLVGWWPLGVHGGDTDFDYSGYGNHGVLTNAPPQVAIDTPRFGGVNVREFGNPYTNGHSVDCPIIQGLTAISVSCWLNGDPNDRSKSSAQWDGHNGWIVNQDNGYFQWYVDTDTTSVTLLQSSSFPSGWHHMVFTFVNGDRRIYVDGVLDASDAKAGDLTTATTGVLSIGNVESGSISGNNAYNGNIHDYRIYDHAISTGVVRSIYEEPWDLVQPIGMRSSRFGEVAAAGGYTPPRRLSTITQGEVIGLHPIEHGAV